MITSVSVKNYCGIVLREETFAPSGAVIHGGNAVGKTSLLFAEERAFATRGKVGSKRATAAAMRDIIPSMPSAESVAEAYFCLSGEKRQIEIRQRSVRELDDQLATARKRLAEAEESRDMWTAKLAAFDQQAVAHEAALANVASLEAQAAELEATIDVPPDPTDWERDVVLLAADEALRVSNLAQTAAESRVALVAADAAKADHRVAEKRAAALDRAVKTLATTAPAELAKMSGIRGVTLVGDEIRVDDVAIDHLIVDGLERLDYVQMFSFVTPATADGF